MNQKIDYWGTYKDTPIYWYYGKEDIKGFSEGRTDAVFVKPGVTAMWYKGVVVGRVDDGGHVSDWDLSRANKKKELVITVLENTMDKKDLNEIIAKAMSRSIDDLVKEKLAEYKDNG